MRLGAGASKHAAGDSGLARHRAGWRHQLCMEEPGLLPPCATRQAGRPAGRQAAARGISLTFMSRAPPSPRSSSSCPRRWPFEYQPFSDETWEEYATRAQIEWREAGSRLEGQAELAARLRELEGARALRRGEARLALERTRLKASARRGGGRGGAGRGLPRGCTEMGGLGALKPWCSRGAQPCPAAYCCCPAEAPRRPVH